MRIGLRSAAIRVLSRQNTFLTCRTRSFHTVLPSITRIPLQRSSAFQLQRRFASSEDQTQSEPVADGAQAQHGDNSIAASSKDNEPGTSAQEGQEGRGSSAQGQDHSTVGELAESAADRVKESASNAFDAIAGSSASSEPSRGTFGGSSARQANFDTPPSTNVYVGNLFFDVREDDLRKKFEECGTIESVKLIMDNRGLSKGYVFFLSLHPSLLPIFPKTQRQELPGVRDQLHPQITTQ
ncbi:MAG: hypothetical protein LQ337_005047 [Flavoplaca oasis]|nr:MAG: hypothetical protein LQ337_005047 [Flavoplaca oasis]